MIDVTTKATDWMNSTMNERFMMSIGVLHGHGIMTDAEKITILGRYYKKRDAQESAKK